MSDTPSEPFYDLLNTLAEHYLAYSDAMEKELDRLMDDQLRELHAELSGQKNPHTPHDLILLQMIPSIIGKRYHLRKAQELGCDCYCFAHECCCDKCPPGGHPDLEEDEGEAVQAIDEEPTKPGPGPEGSPPAEPTGGEVVLAWREEEGTGTPRGGSGGS